MANPIPPLVCSTPPPMDDLEEISQNNDSDFGEYESNIDVEFGSFEGPSLPNTPRHMNVTVADFKIEISPNLDNNKIEEKDKCQTEKIESIPINLSEAYVENIEIYSFEKTTNENNINVIQQINEENLEQNLDRVLDTFEFLSEKLESPPSLELIIQVPANQNNSFEKLSDGKDSHKEFSITNFLESNLETLPKEGAGFLHNEELLQNVELHFGSFKSKIKQPGIEKITIVENKDDNSSLYTQIPAEQLLQNSNEYQNDKSKIDKNDKLLDENVQLHKIIQGCESSESIEQNHIPHANLIFEADFNQLESSLASKITLGSEEHTLALNIDNIEKLEENDTASDALQDFGNVNYGIIIEKEEYISHNLNISKEKSHLKSDIEPKECGKDDNFDDEFGEFSDFKAVPVDFKEGIVKSTNVENINLYTHSTCTNINDKLTKILDIMFPDCTKWDITSDDGVYKKIEKLTQEHSMKTNLNNLDSANALDYQWSNSNIRHSLIKSLGIDSRNILYGEKWNCSMPRFASNLGFIPLEPLKPIKVIDKNQQQSNLVMETNLNAKASINVHKSNVVPEVEFDWNSSGLINPLASHAHTFLLDYDLDQLVVVANLDNLKLDSYSYLYPSSFASTSTSTLLSTNSNYTSYMTTTIPKTTPGSINLMKYFEHRWVDNIAYDNNVAGDTTSGNDTMHNLSDSFNFNSHNTINNDVKNMFMKSGSHHSYAEIENQLNTKHFNNITNTSMNAINETNNKTYDIMYDYSLSSRNKKLPEKQQNNEIHSTTNEFIEINASIKSSKIKNESIETIIPTKYESGKTKIFNLEFTSSIGGNHSEKHPAAEFATMAIPECSNDNDDSARSTKVTSIDTELSSMSETSTAARTEKSSIVDFGLEINSIPLDSESIISSITNITNQFSANQNKNNNDNYLIQHNNFPNDYINIGPSPTTYVVPLKETHIFTPTKSETPVSQSMNDDDFITDPTAPTMSSLANVVGAGIIHSIDFDYEPPAVSTVINEKVIKKEYHDIEYNPTEFGLNKIENEKLNSKKNNDTDIDNMEANDDNLTNVNSNKVFNWTFHLNNLNGNLKNVENENSKNEQFVSEILQNKTDPIPSTFNSNESNHIPSSNFHVNLPEISKAISNDFEVDTELKNIEKFKILPTSIESNITSSSIINSETPNIVLLGTNCGNFDDEFTDFQSVLPTPDYKSENSVQSLSNFTTAQQDECLESSPINKSLKANPTNRNQTPTLLSDDRMILSPAILLPQAVSVNQSVSISNKAPEIEWPEPGISIDELTRLENIFPKAKSSFSSNTLNTELKENILCNDDWSDFVSVPPVCQNNSLHQQSPRTTTNNVSNLNIIYNPQSPTKVSSQRSLNSKHHDHHIKSNDEDEWSDFVSSAPISSNFTNNTCTNNFPQTTNHIRETIPGIQNQLKCVNKVNNSQYLAGNHKYFNCNNIFVPSQQQHAFLNNNNNKISQYLLNNSSEGHIDNHINNCSNNMQLNALKPTDFIPHHHMQHQLLQKQQKVVPQSSSNDGSGTNNISFIPDLGFIEPKNQFINITKKHYQRK